MSDKKRIIHFLRQSSGNLLEWYDYALYGVFAVQISQTFFSASDSQFIALLLTFATFAIGFISRPLGSLLFGYLGDKYGKGFSVNLTIWCMALPTLCLGLLPGYSEIGLLAPLLLVVIRIVQGMSAGGQLSGLISIAADSESTNKPFLVSFIWSISIAGGLIATFVGFVSMSVVGHYLQTYNVQNDYLLELTWRIPFMMSFLLFLLYMVVSPKNSTKKTDEPVAEYKVVDIFKQQPRELVLLVLLNACIQTIGYVLFTYLVTYMQINWSFNAKNSLLWVNCVLVLSVILYPFFGYIVPKFGCRLRQAQIFGLILLPAIIMFGLYHTSPMLGIIGLVIMIVLNCGVAGFVGSLFGELFHTKYRMTACSLSYNIGVIFAGFSPMLAETFNKLSSFGLSSFLLILTAILVVVLGRLRTLSSYKNLEPARNNI
ncbi:MFS transporter [Francisellaceae bacterium]|nr:MFS transporter [Francisellaceae bacterium]